MAFWWAAWLLSNISANAAGRVLDFDSPTAPGAILYMTAGAMTVIAAALAITVIRDITARQEERFRQVGVMPMPAPPPPPTFDQGMGITYPQ